MLKKRSFPLFRGKQRPQRPPRSVPVFGDWLASPLVSASPASGPCQVIERMGGFSDGDARGRRGRYFPQQQGGKPKKNTRGRKRNENGEGMTYQFTLSFPWRDKAAGLANRAPGGRSSRAARGMAQTFWPFIREGLIGEAEVRAASCRCLAAQWLGQNERRLQWIVQIRARGRGRSTLCPNALTTSLHSPGNRAAARCRRAQGRAC